MSRKLFKPDFDNARANQGFDLLSQVIRAELINLVKLNLLTLACSLLLVTIPATITAACRVLVLFMRQEKVEVSSEFFRCFKKEFGASSLGGFMFIAILLACGFAETFYIIYFSANFFGILLVLVGCIMLMIIIIATYHFFVLTAIADLKLFTAIKNAWLLALVRLPNNFLYVIIVFLIISAHIAIWPIALVLIVLISLSFILLLLSVNAYENIVNLVFILPEENNGNE